MLARLAWMLPLLFIACAYAAAIEVYGGCIVSVSSVFMKVYADVSQRTAMFGKTE